MKMSEMHALHKKDMYSVHMCSTCRTVLTEGLELCGQNDDLGVLAYLREFPSVTVNPYMEFQDKYMLALSVS